ncbi:MAG: hypothetical protein PHV30_06630, partial [Candidatus Margulisbacteria bacterium]|nr:hypothetical protein [Candidatus Margulisiibacteriota bacterium]
PSYLQQLIRHQQQKGAASAEINLLFAENTRTRTAIIKLLAENLKLEIKNSILILLEQKEPTIEQIKILIGKYDYSKSFQETLLETTKELLNTDRITNLRNLLLETDGNFIIRLLEYYFTLEGPEQKAVISKIIHESYKQEQLAALESSMTKIFMRYLFKANPDDKILAEKIHGFLSEIYPYMRSTSFRKMLQRFYKNRSNRQIDVEKSKLFYSLLDQAVESRKNRIATEKKLFAQQETPLDNKTNTINAIHSYCLHEKDGLFEKIITALSFYPEDREVATAILNGLTSKVEREPAFLNDLTLQLKESIETRYFNNAISLSELSAEDVARYRLTIIIINSFKNRFFENIPDSSKVFELIKGILAGDDKQNFQPLLHFPEIIVAMTSVLAYWSLDKNFSCIFPFIEHPSNLVRSYIIKTLARPKDKLIDQMIDYLMLHDTFHCRSGIGKILETKRDDPVKVIYKMIPGKKGEQLVKYWRALHCLSEVRDITGRQQALKFFNWSDHFLLQLGTPSVHEPDVQALFNCLEKKYKEFKSLFILKQIRYRGEVFERAVYVISFLARDTISQKYHIHTCFAKQIIENMQMRQNEIEGTNLLNFFNIDNEITMEKIGHENYSFFIRPFFDGFDLSKPANLQNLLSYYSTTELLQDFAYEIGKVALQADLLAKADYGEQNEIITINYFQTTPQISIKHIDLSSSFSKIDEYQRLGKDKELYAYYLKKIQQTADIFNLNQGQKKFLTAKYFNGIMDQYSAIFGRYMQHRFIVPGAEKTDIYTQKTLKRIGATGPDISAALSGLFGYVTLAAMKLDFTTEELLQNIEIMPDSYGGILKELFQRTILDKKTVTDERSWFFSLRDFVLDANNKLDIELPWYWDGELFKFTSFSNVEKNLRELNIDMDMLHKTINFIYDNLDKIIYLKVFDLQKYLREKAQKIL